MLGKPEVQVLTDFKSILDKPQELYKEYTRPVVYMFTNPKGITKEIEKFYDDHVLIISEITKEQAENILLKAGLAEPAIQYFSENISSPTVMRRVFLMLFYVKILTSYLNIWNSRAEMSFMYMHQSSAGWRICCVF